MPSVRVMGLLIPALLGLVACQPIRPTMHQPNLASQQPLITANSPNLSNLSNTAAHAPTDVLIIYYQPDQKPHTLHAIEQLGGRVVYDYHIMNGLAAAFPHAAIAQIQAQLQRTEGILAVLENKTVQLH